MQSLFQGPESDSWAPEGYLEADFGGAGATGNYNESSSFSPRVRHYFADVTYKPLGGTLLFGQTWSLVTGFKTGLTPRQENIPLTIDGQYLPGFDWLRLPQIRLTEKFNDLLAAAVSWRTPRHRSRAMLPAVRRRFLSCSTTRVPPIHSPLQTEREAVLPRHLERPAP